MKFDPFRFERNLFFFKFSTLTPPRSPPNKNLARTEQAPRGAVAARAASGAAGGGDARLAALLAAIGEAKALSARRDADDDETSLFADASALAVRLEEAERENEALRERVAELTALNDDAAAELLEDAAELAAALAKAEDLEEEAEALRVLNARLAEAAEEVAAMVVADDASSLSVETHLEKLRSEADTARAALATAEHRAKLERDSLLSRVRALETELAEADTEPVGGEDGEETELGADALASAREKIEGLSALAARRGDALLQAEAAAAAAAAEVASLKKRLDDASAAAAAATAPLLATIRALETEMAAMLTEEEAAARVRELELAMAEMVDAEEMGALLAHSRALEIEMADMVDAEELVAAEARADALRAESDALRARVRALEIEMASMSDAEDEASAAAREGSWKAKVRSLETEMASMSYDDEASPATAAPPVTAPPATPSASGRKTPFVRDPSGTFSKRALKFAAKGHASKTSTRADASSRPFERAAPETFALRRRTFPPSTRTAAAATATRAKPAGRVAGDAVTFSFGDDDDDYGQLVNDAKTKTTFFAKKKSFERASPESFILRKFDFPAVRARATSLDARTTKPPFSRGDANSYVKRRLTFFDAATSRRTGLAVEGSEAMPVGAFVRSPGVFKLRRFDFIKAKGLRDDAPSSGANANEGQRTRAFTRAGGFSLRRFKFHP